MVIAPLAAFAEPTGLECYKVKDLDYSASFATVELDSAWGVRTGCKPARVKAKYLCNPSTVTVVDGGGTPGGAPTGAQDLSFEFQVCYAVKCLDATMPDVWGVEDEYGTHLMDRPKLSLYCIPGSTP